MLEQAPIKEETIQELKEILDDQFSQLVETYLEDSEQRLVRLQHAVAATETEGVRTEAHSLKGASINLGASRLAELCAAMEVLGVNQDVGPMSDTLTRIQAAFSEARDYLQQQI